MFGARAEHSDVGVGKAGSLESRGHRFGRLGDVAGRRVGGVDFDEFLVDLARALFVRRCLRERYSGGAGEHDDQSGERAHVETITRERVGSDPAGVSCKTASDPASWPSALLKGIAQLVAKRSERTLGFGVRPVGEVAELGLLTQSRNCRSAQPNAAAVGVDLEHCDFQLASDGEGPGHVAVTIEAGLGKRDQAGAPRRQEHEHAKLLVSFDLADDNRSGFQLLAGRVGTGTS